MEKKFLLSYIPAQLKQYPNRWTIIFGQYNPLTQRVEQISKTFNVNRIKDEKLRLQRAKELITTLNSHLLPKGWPFVEVEKETTKGFTVLEDALELAYQIKIRGKAKTSQISYRNQYKTFLDFIEDSDFKLSVLHFQKKHAQEYSDYLKYEMKLGAWAFNNHLGFVKSIFEILVDRDFLPKNPFAKMKREKKTQSRYQVFTEAEVAIIAKRIFEKDIWLFRAILLIYLCYMRKVELTRLRFRMFDLKKGLIRMPMGTVVLKNKKVNIRTIPESILKYFIMDDFTNKPANYLVFGKGFKPHPNKTCSVNTPTGRHKTIIQELVKEKLLQRSEGLHIYSWKFTGITKILEILDLQHVSKQAGHNDVSVTMGYLQAPEVSEHFRNLKLDPLEGDALL